MIRRRAALAWLACAASALHAQGPQPPSLREDRGFLKAAASGARFELEAARLALAHSSTADVRALAYRMQDHHQARSGELERLLHARGLAQPMLEPAQRKALNALQRLEGRRFDNAFMEHLGLRQQREGLRLYEQAAATLQDAAVRSWAERQLPALRARVQATERLALGHQVQGTAPPRMLARTAQR